MKQSVNGNTLKNTSRRPRAYWPPESREENKEYEGSTIDMYQAGILLCKILSPEATRLLSRSVADDTYLYNNDDLQSQKNELRKGIERIEKYIRDAQDSGEKVLPDMKASLEEKKKRLERCENRKEIDVSEVLRRMKNDKECAEISEDLEELIRALLSRSPDARPVADPACANKIRRSVYEFAWVQSSALNITDAELVAEISHRMQQSGKTTKVQWSHHTSRDIVLKKLKETIKERLDFNDIQDVVDDSKLGTSGLVISGVCMPNAAKRDVNSEEKYHRQIVVKCDVRSRDYYYLYFFTHSINQLTESTCTQENAALERKLHTNTQYRYDGSRERNITKVQ